MNVHDVLQAGRFVIVGGASYVLNLATYTIFFHIGIPYIAAAALSFLLGFFFNFAANRWWTFTGRRAGGRDPPAGTAVVRTQSNVDVPQHRTRRVVRQLLNGLRRFRRDRDAAAASPTEDVT
jgi:hypothetical protein